MKKFERSLPEKPLIKNDDLLYTENLVIGFDGLSGVGKTSVAKLLCEKNKNYVHIELGNLYRLIVPFWVALKKDYSLKNIINFIDKLDINYKIIDKEINFEIDSITQNIKIENNFNRNDIYEMSQIKEIRKKVYNSLFSIINNLKNNYTVILTGRELDIIYPDIDYHFYFKTYESDRIVRIMKRDFVSENEAKNRKIEEQITHFSSKVIMINSSRLSIEEIVLMVENSIKFRKRKLRKIQFLGVPSTGKTTISKYCAKKFNGIYAEEKLREYMENRKINFSDLYNLEFSEWCDIISLQINDEKVIESKTDKLIFADSGPLLYAIDFNMLDIIEISNLIKQQLKNSGMIFVCDNDIPYVQDELRPNPKEYDVGKSQQKIIEFLNEKEIPYFILTGTIEERLETVNQLIGVSSYKK